LPERTENIMTGKEKRTKSPNCLVVAKEEGKRATVRSNVAESPLKIRLFGPIEVCLNGGPLPRLSFRKSPLILALLALREGCAVERDWLASLLWPDAARASALQSLRNCLTDLRHALGSEAGRLRSPTSRTLSLELTEAFVDVAAFDAALARGGIEALEEGVSLYRGPLLEGCAEEWVFQERQVREQAYLAARDTLAAHARAQGDLAGAEGHLRCALAVDPLREQAQRALMELLAAGGNYTAALMEYRELRLRLHREMNAEPDPATAALFEQIRADARTKAVRGAECAVRGPNDGGALAARPTDLPTAHRALRAAHGSAAATHHLPLALTRFIGREREIAALQQHPFMASRLLTLTGAGGCGKTRLSIEVARRLAALYPDGVWFVELASLADPALVPQTVAAALGIREQPDRPLIEMVVEVLEPKQLLLLLDNCEHVVATCAQLAESLLRACPHLHILATSREPLGITGEQPYRVPSLSLPQGSCQLSTVLQSEAVRLFVERAATAQPGFALTAENVDVVAQVCCRLDGIPLAIELAAARLKALPLEQLGGRLRDMFSVLTGGSRTALPRHQTLRAMVDWSYDLLTDPEQALLRRLSVFAGGCTLEAAEAVCGDDALDLLTRLVDKSLVLYEERHGEGRYRLLEMIREYGRERLAENGETDALRERQARFFLTLSETAERELQRAEAGRWLDWLEREHDNLRAALAWSIETNNPELGLRMAEALAGFWHPRGYLQEGREQFQRLLAHPAVAAPTAARARALRTAGTFAAHPKHARVLYEESLEIWRRLEDRGGIATLLLNLGYLAWGQWDWSTARALTEESLAIRRELGDRRMIADALTLLAGILRQGIDLPAARALADENMALCRELDDPVRLAQGLDHLACVALDQGDIHAACALFGECLAVARALGDKVRIGWATLGLGGALLPQGDFPAARVVLEESLSLWRGLDHKEGLIQTLWALGQTVRAQEDSAAAYALFQEMLAVSCEVDLSNHVARSLVFLGAAAGDLGRWEEMAAHCAEGLRLSRAGDTIGDRVHIAWGLAGLARAALAVGRPAWAARLLGAYAPWWAGCCIAWCPHEFDRHVSAARAQMDAAEFEAAWAAGQAAPLEQIIAEALEGAPAG
jgi:non-specific serine/threonine protein kinase